MLDLTHRHKVLLYILIVILPTFLISFIIWEKQKNILFSKHEKEAVYMLDIHQSQIDRLISETKTRMETMALFIDQENNPNQIQRALKETLQQEPRFTGLYIANADGTIKIGTQPVPLHHDISSEKCFQSALATKKTAISEVHDKKLITICTPIVNQQKDVNGVLYATLSINYIQNIMNVLSPDLYIVVSDTKNNFLFSAGEKEKDASEKSVQTDITQLPWVLKASVAPVKPLEISQVVLTYAAIVYIFFNIIFLLIQYYLLKRKARLEEEKIKAQKLELVGTLAASTAHEIRNPLTGISGFIQLLKKKYQSEEDQHYFSVIEKEIDRINEIVSEFLVLGKPTAHKHKLYDLNQIIDEVMPIIKSEINLHRTNFQVHMDRHNPIRIYCTKNHIKQVLLNLTKNALEAMDMNGSLELIVKKEANLAVIKVIDTGKGIPEKMMEKIFDPFFTMKDSGTGLGLAICKRIVDMYDGTIEIESKLNVGTTVTIKLPLSNKS
ncbi:ATP-binding protein [Aeribacillus sp. FSL K6-8210]|jgi:Signal transduction histidine kinase|uniref:ATP-binding protein n=1 Tax=unclassified Aeribacillus TaxID=2640495 RepID=UPI0028724BE3|nr:ATP-binding protein [Aeribacillus pallidus]